MAEKYQPNFIDLFAGGGGFTRGFINAGFSPVAAFDNDPRTVETLSGNFLDYGMHCELQDLESFSIGEYRKIIRDRKIKAIDVLIGSPPCPGFSIVGRAKRKNLKSCLGRTQHKSNSETNDLTKTFLNIVKLIRPQIFIFENVDAMEQYDNGNFLQVIKGLISDFNYYPYSTVLNAVNYGVPQKRNRLFVVGVRCNILKEFRFPEKCNKKKVTVKEAIGDLPVISNAASSNILKYEPKYVSSFSRKMRKGMSKSAKNFVFDHVTRNQNKQDLEAFTTLPEGGKYVDLKNKYKRYRDDIFKDKYKKLIWDEPSWTLTAHLEHDCYTHIHPAQTPPRTISVRESARLQSFPDSHFFSGSLGDRFRQIGNAVPPLLAEALALKIKAFL